MKRYEIELDEAVSGSFKEIAIIVECPIEKILSDTLSKYVEIISCKVSQSAVTEDENFY